jgi:hypothetical protein
MTTAHQDKPETVAQEPRKESVACALATSLDAMRNCAADIARITAGTMDSSWLELRQEWHAKWKDRLAFLAREFLPSGSGIDSGVELDMDRSKPNRLVFAVPYHAMNDVGMYDGWRDLTVTAVPSFIHGLEITITGRADEGIKDYVAECMRDALREVHLQSDLLPKGWMREAAPSPAQDDGPNLDCMMPEEVAAFAVRYRNATAETAAEVFPSRPDGYVEAVQALARYAARKAYAMRCRAEGHVDTALLEERACERLHDALPPFARW